MIDLVIENKDLLIAGAAIVAINLHLIHKALFAKAKA